MTERTHDELAAMAATAYALAMARMRGTGTQRMYAREVREARERLEEMARELAEARRASSDALDALVAEIGTEWGLDVDDVERAARDAARIIRELRAEREVATREIETLRAKVAALADAARSYASDLAAISRLAGRGDACESPGVIDAVRALRDARDEATREIGALRAAREQTMGANEAALREVEAERDAWQRDCEAVATPLGYRPGEWIGTSLGREVSELRDSLATTRRERDEARSALTVRTALRVEIEEILGVTSGPASDEQLRAGVEAVRALCKRAETADADREAARVARLTAAQAHSDAVDARADAESWRAQCEDARTDALRYGRERDEARAQVAALHAAWDLTAEGITAPIDAAFADTHAAAEARTREAETRGARWVLEHYWREALQYMPVTTDMQRRELAARVCEEARAAEKRGGR